MTITRFFLIGLATLICFAAYNSEQEIAAQTQATAPTTASPAAVDSTPVSADPMCQRAVQNGYGHPEVATIVVVRCIGSEQQVQGVGTAVRVGDTRWVSAMHVFNMNDKLYVIGEDGYPAQTAFTPTGLHTYLVDATGVAHEVTKWRANASYDIVAFDAPGAQGTIRPLGTPKVGEQVTAYGPYAGKRAPLLASAMVADPLGRWTGQLLELNGLVEHGYSGGPILNGSGYLVGLSYAITEGRTYAVPVAGIAPMITAAV